MLKRPLIWTLGLWILGETVAFMFGGSLYKETSLDKKMSGDSLSVTVEGKIKDIVASETYVRGSLFSCDVKVSGEDDSSNLETNGLLVYSDALKNIDEGSKLRIVGKTKRFETPDNPGEFNKWLYYRTRDLDYLLYPEKIEVISEADGMDALAGKVKRRLSDSIDSVSSSPEEAGIFKAIFLGDSSSLSEDVRSDFQICGVSHILAISGLHLSLIGMAFFNLLKMLRMPRLAASVLADAVLLFYVILTGGRVSAWRAYIMFTLSLIAPLLGKSYDLLSALGLSGILILISKPLYAVDASFQLSFSALAGIGIIAPRLTAFINEEFLKTEKRQKFKKLVSAFVFSFSIQLMTFPIIAYHYFSISVYGIFLNFIVIPLMSVALSSVVLGAMFGALSFLLGTFFIGAAHYVFSGMIFITDIVAHFPFAQIVIGKPEAWQIFVYYILLAGVIAGCSVFKSGNKKSFIKQIEKRCGRCFFGTKPLAIVSLLVLTLLVFILRPPTSDDLMFTALYVGQGDSTVVNLGDGHAVIIDCGSSDKKDVAGSIVLPYLKSKRITNIDMIFLSHVDGDHINGTVGILNDNSVSVAGVAIPKNTRTDEGWNEIKDAAKERDIPIYLLETGDVYKTGSKDVRITALSPSGNEVFADDNDSSMVLKLETESFKALFTGDISSERESELLVEEVLGKVDYLKCAHHGSKSSTSSEFLSVLSPAMTTISAGRGNRYGHPADETLSRLEASGTRVFNTKKSGAIITTVNTDGSMAVETYKNNKQK